MQIQLNKIRTNINIQSKQAGATKTQQHSCQQGFSSPVNSKLCQVYFMGNINCVEKLPAHIKRIRESTIAEAIEFITSKDFFEEKIDGKNWKNPEYLKKMVALAKNPEALRQRADALLSRANQSLGALYQGKSSIIIPWSGGRDSSTILANSLAFFPNKKFRLLTVLNGMTREIENPQIQYKRLLQKFNTPEHPIDITHSYVDCVDDMAEFVIKTAKDDRERLGCPALCSSCKMVMEKALGNVAHQYGANDLVLGYTKYQGIQDWVEQTPEQIKFITEELEKHGIKTNSPLYDVLEYPFDPILSLSSLGVPVKEHKIEMKCRAGGMNPKDLDKKRLVDFLTHKNLQTEHVFTNMQSVISDLPLKKDKYEFLIPKVEDLRQDQSYRDGIFEEKKYHGN